MTIDTHAPQARRTLLVASIGGLAATILAALGRAVPADATNGGSVVLGASASNFNGTGTNEATATTAAYTTSGIGFQAQSGPDFGLYGITTTGVAAIGANALSSGDGVRANTWSSAHAGVRGTNVGFGPGVVGTTGPANPTLPAHTAVFGYATTDSSARGVHGQSTSGRGVFGSATTGFGVRGYAGTGTAIYGQTSGLKSGLALRTVGRVRFDNSVGIATISAGTRQKTVTPGINLTATSAVVATLQGSAGGTTTVHRVVVDAAADTFTIYLTANATANVKVAWHVFG